MITPIVGALWREVARHETIEDSVRPLTSLLQSIFPVDWLLVRRWDAERMRLETVAQVGAEGYELRTTLPTPRRDRWHSWAQARRTELWHNREVSMVPRLCVPEGIDGPVLAAPLWDQEQLMGVLLVGSNHENGEQVIQQVVEAFSVALVNDRRLHEMARLREAAEQDRNVLLSKLERQDVSEAIIGSERGLREVMGRVRQVAPTDAPVLILGETGAGKEVVARAIHVQSRREKGPFLRVNCGAIPTELVDSELFGHEKGSFTGAIAQRKGWFERSDGGTLFLDEVAELPPAAQVRLLRVLQDGSFQRVGGQESHTVDVRIVAATHRDMTSMIRDQRFRQDLWYRISVFPILLPALRDRSGDIPALSQHFSERAGLRLFGKPLTPTPDDLARLVAYDWPGNVRELAAVIERAVILGNGHSLAIAPALGLVPQVRTAVVPVSESRDEIEAALKAAHGRIEGPFGAAAALGVNPHTLRSRMRRLGIEWGVFRK